jgi:hypothetical protein
MSNNKHESSDLGREQKGIHRAFEGPITTNHYTTRFGAGALKVVTGSLLENFGEAELAKLNEIVAVTEILGVTKGSPQRKGKACELSGPVELGGSCPSLPCLPVSL